MLRSIRKTLNIDDSISDERLIAYLDYALYHALAMVEVRKMDIKEWSEGSIMRSFYSGELNAYEDILDMVKPRLEE